MSAGGTPRARQAPSYWSSPAGKEALDMVGRRALTFSAPCRIVLVPVAGLLSRFRLPQTPRRVLKQWLACHHRAHSPCLPAPRLLRDAAVVERACSCGGGNCPWGETPPRRGRGRQRAPPRLCAQRAVHRRRPLQESAAAHFARSTTDPPPFHRAWSSQSARPGWLAKKSQRGREDGEKKIVPAMLKVKFAEICGPTRSTARTAERESLRRC